MKIEVNNNGRFNITNNNEFVELSFEELYELHRILALAIPEIIRICKHENNN